MPDACFAVPRLARVYDAIDGLRDDLDHYEAIIEEFRATSVVDVGCGTGSLACRLAARGLSVIALDPAAASLDVARAKPCADEVTWIHGDVLSLPHRAVDRAIDLAVMTGNVAQVFVDDDEWIRTLGAIRSVLRPDGYLVFEVRDPLARAWEHWTKEATFATYTTPTDGRVQYWVEVIDVALPLVSFRQHYVFELDGERLHSDSTLRFRARDEIVRDLDSIGFGLISVRDAPDRPRKELVCIARVVE